MYTMHEEIDHMKVGELRKMVAAKRKIACPPVSNLSKAGLLSELAAYNASQKARVAAKEHGPVTMKGDSVKEEKAEAAFKKKDEAIDRSIARSTKKLLKMEEKALKKAGRDWNKAEKAIAAAKAAEEAAGMEFRKIEGCSRRQIKIGNPAQVGPALAFFLFQRH
jgi:hypothetical protein